MKKKLLGVDEKLILNEIIKMSNCIKLKIKNCKYVVKLLKSQRHISTVNILGQEFGTQKKLENPYITWTNIKKN